VASSSPGGQALSGGNNNRYPVTPALGAPLGFSQASSAAPALQPLPPAGGPHHDGGMLLPPGVAVTSAAIPAVGGSASPLDTTVQGSTTGPILSVPTGHPVTTALAAAGLSRAWHWLDDGRGVQGYDTAQGQGITSSEYPLSSIAKSMGLIVTGYDLRPHHQQGPSAGVSEFQMPPGAPGHMAPVLVVLRGDHRIDMYKARTCGNNQGLGLPAPAAPPLGLPREARANLGGGSALYASRPHIPAPAALAASTLARQGPQHSLVFNKQVAPAFHASQTSHSC
jgi:hypothetical protein